MPPRSMPPRSTQRSECLSEVAGCGPGPEPLEPRPLEPRPLEPQPLEPHPLEPRPLAPRSLGCASIASMPSADHEYRLYHDLAAWWPLISPPGESTEEAPSLAPVPNSPPPIGGLEVLDL